jgi:lysophospholipase L1-like esterase
MRSARAKVLFMLGSCCLSLLVSEGLLRIGHEPVATDLNDTLLRRSSFFQRDEQLGWLPRPHMVGEQHYYDKVVPFHTNSHGWRAREYPLETSSRTTRIIVLGDAFTWGYRVRDQEVYPEVLESLMEKTDVINLGVPGFATNQELQYFKRAALPHHPDAVILAFSLDNIYEADGKLVNQALAKPAEEPSNSSPQRNEPAAGPVLQLKRYLKDHSALYRWVQEHLTANRTFIKMLSRAGLREPLAGAEGLDIGLLPSLKPTPAFIGPLMALAEATLLELHRLLTEQGIRFIIVLIPFETSIDQRAFDQAIALTQFDRDDFDLAQPYRLLEEFAKTNQIELINPTNAFRQIHRPDDSLYLTHDKHFSPKGHQVFAQEIYRYLTQDASYAASPAASAEESPAGG